MRGLPQGTPSQCDVTRHHDRRSRSPTTGYGNVADSAVIPVTGRPTAAMHTLTRSTIRELVSALRFGECLCRFPCDRNTHVFDQVAQHAHHRSSARHSDIITTQWRVLTNHAFLRDVNLESLQHRANFTCVANIYDHRSAPSNALFVLFTHKMVGGGCFRSGLRLNEQLITQSQDLALRLYLTRPVLDWNEGVTFAGVHFDAWWSKDTAAALGTSVRPDDILSADTGPMTVLALDAPPLRLAYGYDRASLTALVCKILLVYATAAKADSPVIYTGLIGSDASHNNRPLILLLHLLLEPFRNVRPIIFHYPVLSMTGTIMASLQERTILTRAASYLEQLRAARIRTVQDAIEHILEWQLPTSCRDCDLAGDSTQHVCG